VSDTLEQLASPLAGRYLVRREIGRGGMATVFEALDEVRGTPVAVKVLHRDLTVALGPARFQREIEIASSLDHPHILPVLDSGVAAGALYLVMPLVTGESLHDRLVRERQLSVEEAVRLTREIASGLAYAHARGIVHRDIKPENILLQDGRALVADFGIARAGEAAEKLTQTGLSVGTPTYMSPEQAAAERDLDGRSDQYSLACVLYEMLAGAPPYSAPTAQGLMARHALETIPSISIVRQTAPEQVEDALYRALAKAPADRFASVQDFADALGQPAEWRVGRRPPGPRATGPTPAERRRARTRLAAYSTAVVVVMLAGAAVAWRVRNAHAPPATADAAVAARKVAVLYFDDLTPDHRLTPVADGLTESLIGQLERVDQLDVVSANGVAPYRAADVPLDSVQGALGVGSVVRGSVDAAGKDAVQVTVSLFDARTGDRLATTRFKQPAANVLALRDQLADKVSGFLRERIGAEVQLRRARAGTTSGEAWTLVQRAGRLRVRADSLFQTGDTTAFGATLTQADTLLGRAAALDPRWPDPAVVRGEIAARRAAVVAESDPRAAGAWIDTALARAAAALQVDPRGAAALELRGTSRWSRRSLGLARDPAEAKQLVEAAEQDLRAAVSVDPTRAEAWNTLSRVQYGKLNVVESNLAARRAYEADAYLRSASAVLYRLFVTSYDMEQFVDAVRWCDEGRARFPANWQFAHCQLSLLSTRGKQPDVDEGWRLVGVYEQLVPKPQREFRGRLARILQAAVLARAAGAERRPELADSGRRVLERARATPALDPRGELIGYEAFVRTMLGDRDQAVEMLQRYLTAHPEHRAGFARANPWWWRDLQQDPRFRQLVAADS
jgi:serine/threonine-protein kinase